MKFHHGIMALTLCVMTHMSSASERKCFIDYETEQALKKTSLGYMVFYAYCFGAGTAMALTTAMMLPTIKEQLNAPAPMKILPTTWALTRAAWRGIARTTPGTSAITFVAATTYLQYYPAKKVVRKQHEYLS